MWPACPCKDCTERSIGCHSTCGGYKDFTKKIANDKEEHRKYMKTTYWGRLPTGKKKKRGTR